MSKIASITLAAVLAALAAGCIAQAEARDKGQVVRTNKFPPAPKPAVKNAKAVVARAKMAITYTLKDPESARWRSAVVGEYGQACVEVNAKNSYGGYTGFESIYVDPKGNVAYADSSACWIMRNSRGTKVMVDAR